MASLIGEMLRNRQVPSKKRILEATVNGWQSFKSNPIQAIKKGIDNDRLAVELYRQNAGVANPRAKVSQVLAEGIYNGGGKDLTVNIGGALGSIPGATVGGLPGQLAGDWIGAAVTRRALDDIQGVASAAKAATNPKVQNLPLVKRAELLRRRVQKYRQQEAGDIRKEYAKDTIGWGIGNSAAQAFENTGSKVVPLQGGFLAMATVPSAYDGIKTGIRVGKSKGLIPGIRAGAVSTGRRVTKALDPRNILRKGLKRERRMTDSVNNSLQSLPELPEGIDFSRRFSYMINFG